MSGNLNGLICASQSPEINVDTNEKNSLGGKIDYTYCGII